MSSPDISSVPNICPKDTSFDFANPQHYPSNQSYQNHIPHHFLSSTTINTQPSPRQKIALHTTKYSNLIIQEKQKLEKYKAKIKYQNKIPEPLRLLNQTVKPKITSLVQKITALADRLSKLDDQQKLSKRSSSIGSNKYSNNSSSKPKSGMIRKQRSIEEIRRIVEMPSKGNGVYSKQYVPRAQKLNYQPISSRNKIRMLFEDRKAREVILKSHEKRLSHIRSCNVLPGLGREMNFRKYYELQI